MSARVPPRSEGELSESERQLLVGALKELRTAVQAYEPFAGGELPTNGDPEALDVTMVRSAQKRIESAESRLWELREQLLGWTRSPSDLPALSTIDWFSEEDRVYDDVPVPGASDS
jgi:CRISPR/Cas system Type II protein with McrA/HNH and RuvC-like nuclease domain